jgi:adenosylmethionine-8-amino-7-oxononanoate aminotransferase
MSHVMFGGITHPSAVALCRKLVAMTPSRWSACSSPIRVGGGGSGDENGVAVGRPKASRASVFTFRNGYHGDLWRDVGMRSG